MINITTSKQLGIVLPNTNKALAQVLSSATPAELETITQGKDLKSVMNTILKQSANNSSADKELLQLVKNNPTLKNLGDVSTTVKDLLNSIKSDNNPLPIEKSLKNFLMDIKDLKNTDLKQKLENSGVFLESRLKNVQNPQVELKNTLISLVKTLNSSDSTSSRAIANDAKLLLNSEAVKSASSSALLGDSKENTKSLQQLASSVESLISKLKGQIKGADSINNPALAKALEKLEYLTQPKSLTPENFNLSSIKDSLQQVSLYMGKSFTMESKGILDALEKIFASLKGIENSANPKASLEQLLAKNIPGEIAKLSENIKSAIAKTDPVFSKDTAQILNKLEHLNSASKLSVQSGVKEILSNDLKALLLKTGDELAKSPQANQSEIMKNIDKLSLQIDHYQLLSHLSNGSSLYLPFSWDMLEEGNIEMKKSDDDKFYCDIDLKLKEYGELNLKLTLYEKNQLNLHIYSSNEEFKNIVKENIPSLRSALIDTQITPREIRIFEPKSKVPVSPYGVPNDELQMGFEIKA